ncbi:hypothetical protein L596_013588 [Steinernema carpocapsae]|uniref:DNA replication factor RFC1 C-terminal domain-containing protein n=1 Tax=Steinernema carpocapsae TaxID=34508 RepID=A0A4U5P0R8_STECR|nr:hypothetical protein L596_013588 [Steinernema carpocapsae]
MFKCGNGAEQVSKKDVNMNTFEAARRIMSGETNLKGEAGALLHGLQYPAAVRVRELPEHRIVDGETLEKAGAAEDESGDGGHRARGRRRENDSEHGRLEPPSDSGDALLRHPLAPHERQRPLRSMINFPALASDVTTMACDYVEPLQKAITVPLVQKEGEGVREVIDFYNHYALTKEDAESINELATWPDQKAAKIETKVKSALTRALNKEHRLLPYAQEEVAKGRRGKAAAGAAATLAIDEEGNEIELGDEDADESDDEAEEDAKAKPAKAAPKRGGGAARGRGRGRGKGAK